MNVRLAKIRFLIVIALLLLGSACINRYLDLKPCAADNAPVAARVIAVRNATAENEYPEYVAQLELINQSDAQFSGCIAYPYDSRLSGSWGEESSTTITSHGPCAHVLENLQPGESVVVDVLFHPPDEAIGTTEIDFVFRLYIGSNYERPRYLCQLSCIPYSFEVEASNWRQDG